MPTLLLFFAYLLWNSLALQPDMTPQESKHQEPLGIQEPRTSYFWTLRCEQPKKVPMVAGPSFLNPPKITGMKSWPIPKMAFHSWPLINP